MTDEAARQDAPGLARIDFSEVAEGRMHRLAWALGVVGLLQSIFAGIGVLIALWFATSMLGSFADAPLIVLMAIVPMLALPTLQVYQGILLREAGEYIGRVASTDDDDQEHLGAAFRRLRVVFIIEAVLAVPIAARMIG